MIPKTSNFLRVTTILVIGMMVGCGTKTIGVVGAAVGVAGSALGIYCSTNGHCDAKLVAYANLVMNEAVADAVILQSGQTTLLVVTGMINHLNASIAQGQEITGLTPEQQRLVSTIIVATDAFLVMLGELIPPAVKSPALAPNPRTNSITGHVVMLPTLTSEDNKALEDMKDRVSRSK